MVGSGSIEKNEQIAKYLEKEGIKFEILNAKNNEREAAIVAKAGEKGAITLATNIAGRGTDIKLGKGVKELADWLLSVQSDMNHAELTISCAVVADARAIQARLSFTFRPKMI